MRAIIRAEVLKAKNGQFFAHLIGANNRKVFTSGETLHNEADAHKAIRLLFVGIIANHFKATEADEPHRSEVSIPYTKQSLKPTRTPFYVP